MMYEKYLLNEIMYLFTVSNKKIARRTIVVKGYNFLAYETQCQVANLNKQVLTGQYFSLLKCLS